MSSSPKSTSPVINPGRDLLERVKVPRSVRSTSNPSSLAEGEVPTNKWERLHLGLEPLRVTERGDSQRNVTLGLETEVAAAVENSQFEEDWGSDEEAPKETSEPTEVAALEVSAPKPPVADAPEPSPTKVTPGPEVSTLVEKRVRRETQGSRVKAAVQRIEERVAKK